VIAADVVFEKGETIARALARARAERAAATDFTADLTRQDAAILNLQRACEAAIDIANILVRHLRLPPAAKAREAFDALALRGVIDASSCARLGAMVGFRNVAVHGYRRLDLRVVERIIAADGDELLRFARRALEVVKAGGAGGATPAA